MPVLFLCSHLIIVPQLLISGSVDGFDIDDLRANTNYAGGYRAVSLVHLFLSYFIFVLSFASYISLLKSSCFKIETVFCTFNFLSMICKLLWVPLFGALGKLYKHMCVYLKLKYWSDHHFFVVPI